MAVSDELDHQLMTLTSDQVQRTDMLTPKSIVPQLSRRTRRRWLSKVSIASVPVEALGIVVKAWVSGTLPHTCWLKAIGNSTGIVRFGLGEPRIF